MPRILMIILLVAVTPLAAVADITTDLVGYWPFTGDAQDASANGNHGTLVNGPTLTSDRHGNPDAAYHFDGLSTRIDVVSSASLSSPTTAITLAAYIRRDGWGMVGTLYNPILTKSLGATNAFQYRFITTTAGFSTAFNSWNTQDGASYDFLEDVWYHVAATWEADTLKSYLNGALVETDYLPTTLTPDNRTLSIGSDVPGVLEIFYGDIDEVRIYSRALSPEDIAELVDHLSAAPETFRPGPGLVLGQAFPNPVNVAAAIPFSLHDAMTVHIDIVDVAGRRVRTLLSGRTLPAGPHSVQWDGRDAAGRPVVGGMYLYRVTTPRSSASGKLIISR